MSDQSANVGHAFRIGNQIRGMSILLGIFTAVSVVVGLTIGSWSWLLLAGCAVGWGVLAGYYLLNRTVIEPVGDAIGRILVPTGGSTPSVAQHSQIETMEVRGEYAKAADAYEAIIAGSPDDIVACEKLGQLALRHLKDYERAIRAYRAAEQRHEEPRRKLGYAILVAGIYRDNLEDNGKAIVELRRILARYPDAPNTDRLRAELDELKARHFEGT